MNDPKNPLYIPKAPLVKIDPGKACHAAIGEAVKGVDINSALNALITVQSELLCAFVKVDQRPVVMRTIDNALRAKVRQSEDVMAKLGINK